MKDPLNIQGKAVNFDLTKYVCVLIWFQIMPYI